MPRINIGTISVPWVMVAIMMFPIVFLPSEEIAPAIVFAKRSVIRSIVFIQVQAAKMGSVMAMAKMPVVTVASKMFVAMTFMTVTAEMAPSVAAIMPAGYKLYLTLKTGEITTFYCCGRCAC